MQKMQKKCKKIQKMSNNVKTQKMFKNILEKNLKTQKMQKT